MAKTIINLSDPVSTLVSKTNIISNHLGDITQLNVGSANDSDIVQAINFVNGIVQKTDSADIINLIDSNYVQARQTGIARSSTLAFFIKDSANGIGLDSSEGRFFIPSNTINTAMIESTAITTAKIAGSAVDGTKIAADAVDGTKIADNSINSEHYVDGSIDREHLAGDIIDGTKIADDVINSEHYVNGSIDSDHLASNSVTQIKIADDAVGSAELKSLSTLLIKDSSGTTLKTIHGAGA